MSSLSSSFQSLIVKMYRKAEEMEDSPLAEYKLGLCYEYGEGVEKDMSEAVKWYRKSAEQGYAQAQCNLGDCYYRGEGVRQDQKEAAKWYRKSAKQGFAKAQEQPKKRQVRKTSPADEFRKAMGLLPLGGSGK